MLVQSDPFRELDTFFGRLASRATASGPGAMDAYRRGNDLWLHIDVPGVSPDSLDISVERGVLSVSGERRWHRQEGDRMFASERPAGAFRRQVQLGEGLDLDAIEADLQDGVLTLRIPVAERAQPRKISITTGQPAIEAAEVS